MTQKIKWVIPPDPNSKYPNGEHPEARWFGGSNDVHEKAMQRDEEVARVVSDLDDHVCPLDPEEPDAGCALPEAHQMSGAVTLNQADRLATIYEAAKKWAAWRQGQCDYPKGVNPEEQELLDALGK